MEIFIPIIAIVIAGTIPITAIVTAHIRGKEKIKLQLIQQEIELEKIRLKGQKQETEKLRLELQKEGAILLEAKH